MARHHKDLTFCRKMAGTSFGLLCERCDGKCMGCDSLIHPAVPVRLCDDCANSRHGERCISCQGPGVTVAQYCRACVMLEKDRDGCPRTLNVTGSKAENRYDRQAGRRRPVA